MNRRKLGAFTLVELLVVIGIIALLMGILLPSLNKARQAAMSLKCSANLRTVGQGLAVYIANNKGTLPTSYVYEGMSMGPPQTPDVATQGYLHWSGLLYGSAVVAPEAFTCPSLDRGGLPPTNPKTDNIDPLQVPETAGIIDRQAPRMAYTLNEAVCGRNKFATGFQGAVRTYQYVRAGTIKQSARTIMATEFINNWLIVSDAPRGGGGSAVCKSHRPVHGFKSTGGSGPGALNMEKLASGSAYRRVTYDDLTKDCPLNYDSNSTNSRLDWVGRNHGTGSYDLRKTNFLYVDGHVETKNIKETLTPTFEWGEQFYSLRQREGLQ